MTGEKTPRKRLSKPDRQKRIVEQLQATPTIRVSDLAATLDVSTETIRRDLDEMDSKGLINRTYGGAMRPVAPEPHITERHQMLVAERESIARTAAKVVAHGDVIIIGGGSTTTHVARRLATEKRNLKVFTDSFAVATVLSINPTISVHICPGRYHAEEGCVCGAETVSYLERIYAKHAFLGASGLVVDGPAEADFESAATYRAMARRAAEVSVVADHSKFDRAAVMVYASWSHINRLITDVFPGTRLAYVLEEMGVDVFVADAGP